MTWEAFHHRGEVLHTVIAEADVRRDGTLPMDLPGVTETFRGELDVLATLQLRWHTRLAGHVERRLADEPLDLEAAVALAWLAAAEDMPGIRAVLDHHAAHPTTPEMARVMGVATGKEHEMLALMAGRASAPPCRDRSFPSARRRCAPRPGRRASVGSSRGTSAHCR